MGYGDVARRIVGLLVVGAVAAGCGGGSGGTTGPGQTPAIAISLNPTSASVAQGGSTTVTATLTRSGRFTGAVTITVTGAPTGVTGGVSNPQTSGATTTATVTVDVAASTTPGTYTLTVTGAGSGVSNATATFTLTVTQAGGFTIAGSAVSVAQSGNGTSTITITRTGGFAGSVALSTTSVPTGLTASFNPASTTGNSSTLTVTATAGITPGSYTIAIKGAATGLADQTASIAVTVTATTGGGGNAQVNLTCFAPIWVAYQDGNGAWTRATTVSANTYRISVTGSSAGVAWVFPQGNGFQIQVNYFPAAFLTSAATVSLCGTVTIGTKSVTGVAAGLSGGDRARMSMGGSTGQATTNNLNFALNTVLNGAQDLLGWRHDPIGETGASVNPDRGFVRRDQNVAHLGTLGTIDFAGSESFAPATGTITLPGVVAGELITHTVQYLTRPECVSGSLYQTSVGDPSPFVARGFPASVQRNDDYHYLSVSAVTGSGTPVIGHTSSRSVAEVFKTMGNRTMTLPPSIATAAVTTLSGPYKRLQVVYPGSTQFNQSASLVYTSLTPLRLAGVVVAGTVISSGQVTIAMPDFTGVAGFDPTWLPATAATGTWSVQTAGSTFATASLCQEGGQFWSAAALGQF